MLALAPATRLAAAGCTVIRSKKPNKRLSWTFVVKLGRLGRPTGDMLDLVHQLEQQGAHFRSA
jgi:DNA invertase Pin-like site-specific DNA recombinase